VVEEVEHLLKYLSKMIYKKGNCGLNLPAEGGGGGGGGFPPAGGGGGGGAPKR
jgi:hypothetical protein